MIPAKRIGLLGGTFDPIHQGHIALANFVIQALSLDELQLIPNHVPPHKHGTQVAAHHRLHMAELAATANPKISVNDIELSHAKPSYSIHTLAQLRKSHPHDALFFIMGMDSFCQLSTWHRWQELQLHCHLVVCQREGDTLPSTGPEAEWLKRHAAVSNSQALWGEIFCLNNPNWPISSSQIRQSLGQIPADTLELDATVYQYIQQHQLYRSNR